MPKKEIKQEGILLSPKHLGEITALFGGEIIKDADDLVDKLKRSQTIRFESGLEIILTDEDLWSLQQMAIGMDEPYEPFVVQFIEDAICYSLTGGIRGRY